MLKVFKNLVQKKNMKQLTKKQQYVYDYISNFIQTNKFSPSYQDILKAFNFSSTATVRTYLEHLEKKGAIQRSGKARAIKLMQPPNKSIPILGEIAAGNPLEAIENIIDYTDNITCLKNKNNRYGLKIKGDSMIEEGILDKDIIIIEKKDTYTDNDIVAILIDNQATLKRIKIEKDKIHCFPANKHYTPFEITKEQSSHILGLLIGLIRNYK